MRLTETEIEMISLFRAMNEHQKTAALALAGRLQEEMKTGDGFRMATRETTELEK